MFENTNSGEVLTIDLITEKTYSETKVKSKGVPLQPSSPNTEKKSIKKLGPYEFSMDQRIGSGMTGDAYVGINTQNHELVCIKIVDR
jgi:hypothetical protein